MNYISQNAKFGANVKLGKGTIIEDNVVIGDNVRIGNNVSIQENIFIESGTIVGNNVVLGERSAPFYDNPEEYETLPLHIGKNCVIRSGSVIYEGSEFGDYFQTGSLVSIRERNKFGKGSIFGTMCQCECDIKVGNYSRIINGVEIGKKADIGNHVFIFAHAVLTDDPHPPLGCCGIHAAKIDDYAIIGPHVILMPHIRIGKGAIIGGGSVVTKDVPDEMLCLGTPAKPIKNINQIRCIDENNNMAINGQPYPWIKNLKMNKEKLKRYNINIDDINDFK